MATYDYSCSVCGFIDEYIHSMNAKPDYFCPECKKAGNEIKMEKIFTLNSSGFIIKGGTESIHWKEKRNHLKKNADLGVKQIERYGSGPSLKPNIAGVEVESWSDAAKLAKESGLDSKSFAPLIEKEKRTSKVSGIDDSKWKKAKQEKSVA